MKILLQNSLYWPNMVGGAEKCAVMLAVELKRRGHEVHVLTTTGKHGKNRVLRQDTTNSEDLGIIHQAASHGLYDLIDLPAQRPGILTRGIHHYTAIHSPRWRRLVQELLKDLRPDVFHTNSLVGMTPAIWKAAHECGVPIVHTLHDFHLLCPRNTLLRSDQSNCDHPPLPCRVLSRLKLAATRDVQAVTAPSDFHLQKHLLAGGFPNAKSFVVPNACEEIPEHIPVRDVTSGPLRALFLGALESHKGIDLLLQAARKIMADSKHKLHLDFAGTGSGEQEVQKFCHDHAGSARYHGFVAGSRKSDLLAQAHVILVPSVCHDNSPRTILDAFAWGIPVIASRRGGIPELVRDGREGWLIQPNSGELETALRRYLDNRVLLAEHGKAAAARSANYTLALHLARFEDIYSSLITSAWPKAGRS